MEEIAFVSEFDALEIALDPVDDHINDCSSSTCVKRP
jgi:hypothetical protein